MMGRCDTCGATMSRSLLWVYAVVDKPRKLSSEVKAKRSAIAELSPAAAEFMYSSGFKGAIASALTEDFLWGVCDICHTLLQQDRHPRELLERCRQHNLPASRQAADGVWGQLVIGVLFLWFWRDPKFLPVRGSELMGMSCVWEGSTNGG